jgi:hypothetical protein
MSLNDLIDEVEEEDEDGVKLFEEDEEEESSGLGTLVGVKSNKDKLSNPETCPECATDDTEQVAYYWRCNNDNCKTLTYIPTKPRIDRTEM